MRRSHMAICLLGAAAALLGGGGGRLATPRLIVQPATVQAASDPGQPAFYTESVQPILQANCTRCHGGLNHRGGLNIETRDNLLKGGHHGPAIVPGHPEQSLLVKLIRHEGPANDPMNMPPDPRPKISDANIAVIESWIRAGAVMPPPPS